MLGPIFNQLYPITQAYGNKLIIDGKDFYGQFGLNGHEGIDFGCLNHTTLLAAIDGTVTVQNDGNNGYGLSVRIVKTREDGLTGILYGHLSSTALKTGDVVKTGDIIGFSGASGDATVNGKAHPHLHFGLRFRDLQGNILNADNGFKGRVNPMDYFPNGKYRK